MRIRVQVWMRTGLAALLLAGIAGCSGGSKTPAPTTPAPSPDFSLSVSPATQAVTAGGSSVQVSLLATATGGFNSPVSVAVTGLGNGVITAPATVSLTPGTASTVTISAAANATAGAGTITFTGTSGGLSHAATMTVTVSAPAPPPDFSLSVTPTTQTVNPGGAAVSVSLLASGSNGFSSPVAVTANGLGSGVTISPSQISLTPGSAATVTITASANAPAGTETVTFTGSSGNLSHGVTLALTVAAPQTNSAGLDITTYHYDNTRQGWNQQETLLTTQSVKSASFGLIGNYKLDGKVDAAPLYLGNVALPSGPANVLYVATEHDSVFALDPQSGKQIWKFSALKQGEITSDPRGCGQITPEIGITSTPVIDRGYGTHGAIFFVAMSKDANGGYHQRLHAVDLITGTEIGGGPTEITASYPGSGAGSKGGQVVFDPGQYAERAGLLLLNSTIYLTWTSHCDIAPYTGWVMGYSEQTLQQNTVLNLTPNGSDGAVWMSGYGMAADTDGNIYFLDANGTLDAEFDNNGFPKSQDYGNAILKLSTTSGLKVADYWEPFNTQAESVADRDLGSGGGMLLPDMPDSTGTMRRLLVGAGKDKKIYVADCGNLGKFNPTSDSNLYQEVENGLSGGAWSGPAYFNGTVFYGGVNDTLRAYPVVAAKLATTPSSVSAATFGYPGTTPSVSSNGNNEGIVWAVESGTGDPAVLHAYDAADLSHELYNSKQAAGARDSFGNGNKFITPVVSNGMVFVGTPSGVAVFGLIK